MDHRAFIQANTRPLPVPSIPSIRLYQADEVTPLWLMTEADMDRSRLAPPFWAFAWSGGQALATYVLDHPEAVAGKRVLDLACGSGLVGIAAARAGAAQVTCNDIDPFAAPAVALNAELNDVQLDFMPGDLLDGEARAPNALAFGKGDSPPEPLRGQACVASERKNFDLILAGDIAYERPMTEAMLTFLRRARAQGATVLVGDPHRAYFPKAGFRRLADYVVRTNPAIEDAAEKPATVWELL